LISFGILIVLPLLTFLIGGVSLTFEHPELKQLSKTIYNYIGGVAIIPELMALAAALSLYTATFIAECVRAGIMGVTKGQKEAAASIGLTPAQILRLVIMPQALRIIIPPTTNQYLNLTKNSSLAAAIAYPDIVLVFAGTAMMQTHKGVSCFIVEKEFNGFESGKAEEKLGIRASDTCELYFDNVKVPSENRIGKEGEGFKIALATLDGGRIGIASQALGIAILKPSPSLPILFSEGTLTLSKYNSHVSDALIPNFSSAFPDSNPLNSFSTIKQDTPLCVCIIAVPAKTKTISG
jgi:hypothetical protein